MKARRIKEALRRKLGALLIVVLVLGMMPGNGAVALAEGDSDSGEDNYVAEVCKDATTTKVSTLEEAFTEASSGATIKLLKEVSLQETLVVSNGAFVLDLAGKNITATGTVISCRTGANLTIQGEGKIVSNEKNGVEVKEGTLCVSGAGVEITGGAIGLEISGDGQACLSGGTYSGVEAAIQITNSSITLGAILLNDIAEKHYAYFKNDVPLNITNSLKLDGTITVKNCTSMIKYKTLGSGKHQGFCEACGYVKKEEQCQFKDLTCDKCQSSLTITLGAIKVVYNGTAHTPNVQVSLNGKDLDKSNYEVKYKDNKNAGSATVIVSGQNGYSFSKELTFTIEKKPLSVAKAIAKSKTYDKDEKIEIEKIELEGKIDSDDVFVDITNIKGTLGDAKAGTYTLVTLPALTLTGAAVDNYTLMEYGNPVTASAVIERAAAEIIVPLDSYDKFVDDKEFSLGITGSHTETDLRYEIKEGNDVIDVSSKGAVTIKGKGNATIKVSLPETENYKAASSKTITIKINPSKIPVYLKEGEKVTLKENKFTYGKKLSDLEFDDINHKFIDRDGTVVVGTISFEVPDKVLNVGTHTVSWIFTPKEETKYNSTKGAVQVIVEKASKPAIIPERSMNVSSKYKEVGEVKELPENWEWSDEDKNKKLEIGQPVTARAIYTGADKDNYEITEVEVTITKIDCEHEAGDILYTRTEQGEKPPTCTEEGIGHKECTKCQMVIESGIKEKALGHDYKGEVTTEPTTEKEGVRTYTCSRCDHTYTESIPKLSDNNPSYPTGGGHQHFFSSKITKEPTCTERGIRTYSCPCGASYTDEIEEFGEHQYTSQVTKQPTATTQGVRTYTCNYCKKSYTEAIAKLGSGEEEKPEGDKDPDPSETTVSKATMEKNGVTMNTKLTVGQIGSKIYVEWGRVSGADGYDVYVQYCGKDFTSKPSESIKGTERAKVAVSKIDGKKLDLKKNYKIYVAAYKLVGGKKVSLGKSITAHGIGRENKSYTNASEIVLKKDSYNLKSGETATISASTVRDDKNKKLLSNAHAKEFRYASSNKNIATVSSAGKIKAVGKGSCTVYVYSRNGYAEAVKVTVK